MALLIASAVDRLWLVGTFKNGRPEYYSIWRTPTTRERAHRFDRPEDALRVVEALNEQHKRNDWFLVPESRAL